MNTCCRPSTEFASCIWSSTNVENGRDDLAARFLPLFSKNCNREVKIGRRSRRDRVAVSMSLQTDAANRSDGLTYKDAGVDIDAGSELVRRIAKMAPGIGGFGGLFPLGTCSRL